ncbi:Leucine-rich repeat-containing protein 75A [Bagarius yarrelli]|uniref:Leucine-rich repeat-containing protein 75A n=1 Tax=Bagarius yarrelli TaxID=175774 RepID=A0A556VUI6_BAGYA|nr:Leucine-rich repeat-containing protein 75A [Bagarius yarrelli]
MGSRLSRQSSLDGGGGGSRRRGGGGGGGRRKRADSGGEREPSAPFPAAVMLLRSDRLRASVQSPYVRRVAWIRDIQHLLRERKVEEAASVLRQLRRDSDMLKSSDKICRQLIYHLTPHSKWLRQSMSRRKAQAWLKTTLQKKLCSDSVDLSGIPLSTRDLRHVAYYLHTSGGAIISVDLSFTELRDEGLRILLPVLSVLPKLTTLALNGNRLTVSIMKDLTEALKTPQSFNCLAWIDLGNNVDIFTMPQPLLVALRRRCSLKSSLPTIYEYTEGQPYCYRMESSIEEQSLYEEDEEEDEDEDEMEDKLDMEQWSIVEQKSSGSFTLNYCER